MGPNKVYAMVIYNSVYPEKQRMPLSSVERTCKVESHWEWPNEFIASGSSAERRK